MIQAIGVKDPFEAYAEACFYIEKELHQTITPDYPYSKFLVQIELLNKEAKRLKRQWAKVKRRARHP